MKPNLLAAGLAISVLAVLAIQQFRIARYRDRISALEAQLAATVETDIATIGSRRIPAPAPGHAPGSKTGGRPAKVSRPSSDPAGSGAESLGKSLRQMSENPAGRAMMNQGIKAMSAVWFADLVDEFGLSREEEDYFLRLVAGSMSAQQNIGMKVMTAKTAEERKALEEEIESAKNETREAVKSFLNNDEDFAAYERYEEQLPERQQLEALRDTMLEAGFPLTPDQEDQVIEAMFQVRTSRTDGTDWHGAGGMEAIAGGDAVEMFEQEWEESSRATAEEVGKILEGEQLEAFKKYQVQIKDMQLMGIRMAEKMFQPEKDAPAEE